MTEAKMSGKSYVTGITESVGMRLSDDNTFNTLTGIAESESMSNEMFMNLDWQTNAHELRRLEADLTEYDIDQFADLLAGRAFRAIVEGARPYAEWRQKMDQQTVQQLPCSQGGWYAHA